MSLGLFCGVQGASAPGGVPSSIRLDHGDLLVMNGPAQVEYAHRTVSGLRGPRVNPTYRWVTQHTASCPLAGAAGCVLSSCVRGFAERGSQGLGEGENKWISFWGLVLLLSILVFFLLVNTWIHNWKRHRHSCRRPSHLAVHFPSRGRARWVGGRRWRLSRRCQSPKRRSFYFPFVHFWWRSAQGCQSSKIYSRWAG